MHIAGERFFKNVHTAIGVILDTDGKDRYEQLKEIAASQPSGGIETPEQVDLRQIEEIIVQNELETGTRTPR